MPRRDSAGYCIPPGPSINLQLFHGLQESPWCFQEEQDYDLAGSFVQGVQPF